MKQFILSSFLCLIVLNSFAQEKFTATVSNDSILLGNQFTIEFKIENTQGEFEAPDFTGMTVVSGPNMMSSMQSINGKSTSSITYSYIVEPIEAGELIIGQAYLISAEESFETDFIKVNVYPNPDGIIQKNPVSRNGFNFGSTFGDFFGNPPIKEEPKEKAKPKKKYKLKKI